MARTASASNRTDGWELMRAGETGPDRSHHLFWRDDAACGAVDPDLFFPDGDIVSIRIQVKAAKAICRGCPVSTTCLSWALASGQEFGIWGGLTEDERRGLQRRLRLRSGLAGAPAA